MAKTYVDDQPTPEADEALMIMGRPTPTCPMCGRQDERITAHVAEHPKAELVEHIARPLLRPVPKTRPKEPPTLVAGVEVLDRQSVDRVITKTRRAVATANHKAVDVAPQRRRKRRRATKPTP